MQFGIDGVGATSKVILAPVQEVPGVGRTPVYWAGLAIFVLFQLPILLAKNMGTILVFRFLSAFSGSACLATGGSSLAGQSLLICYKLYKLS